MMMSELMTKESLTKIVLWTRILAQTITLPSKIAVIQETRFRMIMSFPGLGIACSMALDNSQQLECRKRGLLLVLMKYHSVWLDVVDTYFARRQPW